jgi:hypothetical protein
MGYAKWMPSPVVKKSKTNIAAVFTRSNLNELGSQNSIQWGHQLTNFEKIDDGKLTFLKSMARQK